MIERVRRYLRAHRRGAQDGRSDSERQRDQVSEAQRRLEDARQRLKRTVPPPEDGDPAAEPKRSS